MMTRRRPLASSPLTMAAASSREVTTVPLDSFVCEISCCRRFGGVRGLYPRTINDRVKRQFQAHYAQVYSSNLPLQSSTWFFLPTLGFSMYHCDCWPSAHGYLDRGEVLAAMVG